MISSRRRWRCSGASTSESRLDGRQLAQAFHSQCEKLGIRLKDQSNIIMVDANHDDVLYASECTVMEIDRFFGHRPATDTMIKIVNPVLHREKY